MPTYIFSSEGTLTLLSRHSENNLNKFLPKSLCDQGTHNNLSTPNQDSLGGRPRSSWRVPSRPRRRPRPAGTTAVACRTGSPASWGTTASWKSKKKQRKESVEQQSGLPTYFSQILPNLVSNSARFCQTKFEGVGVLKQRFWGVLLQFYYQIFSRFLVVA